MAKLGDLHKKWLKSKKYRKAHGELAPEFAKVRAAIQAEVARLRRDGGGLKSAAG